MERGIYGTMKGAEKDRMKATQFYLDEETHKKLRIAAIEDGISMTEALRQAVSLWFKSRKERKKASKKEG